jgi:hypothetical protein
MRSFVRLIVGLGLAAVGSGLPAGGGDKEEQKAILALDQIADIEVQWENDPGSAVVGLTINADRLDAPVVAQIKHLKNLRSFAIHFGIHVKNPDLAALAGLTHLEHLDLDLAPVGDDGLGHLEGLTALRFLRLGSKNVTDAGLAHLKGLTRLEELALWTPRITDAGLAHLAGLVQMRRLVIGSKEVSDAGLVHLRGLTKVQTLNLSGTQVRGPGLAHLARMTDLEMLSLQDTKVTERGPKHLPTAKRLRWVNVSRTAAQVAGLGECPEGKVKLEVSGLTARLRDARTGALIGEPLRHSVDRRGAKISCWAFSPDGRLLAIGAGYDGRDGERESLGELRVWDTATGALVATYENPSPLGAVRGVIFHKDSKTVVFQADRYAEDGK